MEKAIEDMSKDELDIYARDKFAVELDKRRRIEDLVEHVKTLANNKGKVVEAAVKAERKPKIVRHLKTGVEWFWSPLYKGNPDLEVIEWE